MATTSMAGLLLEGHAVVPQRLLARASPVLLARLFQGILPHPATSEVACTRISVQAVKHADTGRLLTPPAPQQHR